MSTFAKHLVSKKKRRFLEHGFDLDMTFITKNVVAMGFPSEGKEGIYRNHMKDVKKYFDGFHKDHYKVYNLCSERHYNPEKFYGRVAKYPFDDHNAPPFVLMQPFCEDVHAYLSEDPRNVAVIHCKAGKGRTGVMICAYLLHCKMWTDTQDALDFYGHARTKNGKGVTIPSQIRFVHYYGRMVREGLTYTPKTLILKKMKLVGIPMIKSGTCTPFFTMKQGPDQVIIHKSNPYEGIGKTDGEAELVVDPPCPVCGDIKLEFFHKQGSSKEKMFNVWLNTFFIVDGKMVAEKKTIDKANKDKKHKTYPETFAVEFEFDIFDDGGDGAAAVGGEKAPMAIEGGGASATGGGGGASASEIEPVTGEWDDADLTTDDEDDEDDEWEGLPVSDL